MNHRLPHLFRRILFSTQVPSRTGAPSYLRKRCAPVSADIREFRVLTSPAIACASPTADWDAAEGAEDPSTPTRQRDLRPSRPAGACGD